MGADRRDEGEEVERPTRVRPRQVPDPPQSVEDRVGVDEQRLPRAGDRQVARRQGLQGLEQVGLALERSEDPVDQRVGGGLVGGHQHVEEHVVVGDRDRPRSRGTPHGLHRGQRLPARHAGTAEVRDGTAEGHPGPQPVELAQEPGEPTEHLLVEVARDEEHVAAINRPGDDAPAAVGAEDGEHGALQGDHVGHVGAGLGRQGHRPHHRDVGVPPERGAELVGLLTAEHPGREAVHEVACQPVVVRGHLVVGDPVPVDRGGGQVVEGRGDPPQPHGQLVRAEPCGRIDERVGDHPLRAAVGEHDRVQGDALEGAADADLARPGRIGVLQRLPGQSCEHGDQVGAHRSAVLLGGHPGRLVAGDALPHEVEDLLGEGVGPGRQHRCDLCQIHNPTPRDSAVPTLSRTVRIRDHAESSAAQRGGDAAGTTGRRP